MKGKPKDKRQERRKVERFSCTALACSCSIKTDAPGKTHGAMLSDISIAGLSFEADFEMTPGERLSVEIRPIEGSEFEAAIKIVHSRRSQKAGFFLIGASFEDLTGRNRQSLLILLDTIGRMERDLSQA